MIKELLSALLITTFTVSCTPADHLYGPNTVGHEKGETLFTVIFNNNGDIEKVLDRNRMPIPEENIFPRDEHNKLVEELRERNPKSVEVVIINNPIDKIAFREGENQIQVGLDRNGDVTEVLLPVSENRILFRDQYDGRVEELIEQNPDSVKVVTIKDPPDEIAFHPGSRCHDKSSNGVTYEDCSRHRH